MPILELHVRELRNGGDSSTAQQQTQEPADPWRKGQEGRSKEPKPELRSLSGTWSGAAAQGTQEEPVRIRRLHL